MSDDAARPSTPAPAESAQMRAVARDSFLDALAESSITKAFAHQVQCDRTVLRVADDLYDLSSFHNVRVISFGKAGHAMAEALARIAGSTLSGIVVDVSE